MDHLECPNCGTEVIEEDICQLGIITSCPGCDTRLRMEMEESIDADGEEHLMFWLTEEEAE